MPFWRRKSGRLVQEVGGYLWMHSYGYAPSEPIVAEGINGWRVIFGRVLASAKEVICRFTLRPTFHSSALPRKRATRTP